MRQKIINLSKQPFIRNIVIMVSGSATAQIITIALSPIITRLYGPEAFGMFGVFMAIVGVISPIAALTYPISIVLPKYDDEAKELVLLSFYITTGMSLAFFLILFIFNDQIVTIFNIENIASFLFLIPIVILFSGILQIIEQWLIRTKQFNIIARVAFLHAGILNGSKVGIGIFYPLGPILIILSTLGQALKAIMMLLFMNKNMGFKHLFKRKFSIRKLANKYKDFPMYRAPQVFINAISQSLPVLLLASLFGPVSAGYYSLGRTVLNVPTQIVGKSVGDVFYSRITEASNNNENVSRLLKKSIIGLSIVGILPFGLIVLFGPWIFSLIFGEDWLLAGKYARWMALWLFSMFIYQPCIRAFPVLNLQNFHLKYTVITLIINLASLVIGSYVFSDDIVAIMLFGFSGMVLNFILIIFTLKISKKYDEVNKTNLTIK